MNSELARAEARLAELKERESKLELGIRGDIAAVREVLDPYAEDVALIQADVAAAQAFELAEKVGQLRDVRVMIARIKQDLGR